MRPYIPLVLSGGRIVWVVGHRIAEPFKVRGGYTPGVGTDVFGDDMLGGLGVQDPTGRRLSRKEPVCYDARIVKR